MLSCPDCGSPTAVIDSRDYESYLRRRRLCKSCRKRFTTYEKVALEDSEILAYREAYPADTRSDKQIKEILNSLEGKSAKELLQWIISKGGMK